MVRCEPTNSRVNKILPFGTQCPKTTHHLFRYQSVTKYPIYQTVRLGLSKFERFEILNNNKIIHIIFKKYYNFIENTQNNSHYTLCAY